MPANRYFANRRQSLAVLPLLLPPGNARIFTGRLGFGGTNMHRLASFSTPRTKEEVSRGRANLARRTKTAAGTEYCRYLPHDESMLRVRQVPCFVRYLTWRSHRLPFHVHSSRDRSRVLPTAPCFAYWPKYSYIPHLPRRQKGPCQRAGRDKVSNWAIAESGLSELRQLNTWYLRAAENDND